jgi:hypothetical protein
MGNGSSMGVIGRSISTITGFRVEGNPIKLFPGAGINLFVSRPGKALSWKFSEPQSLHGLGTPLAFEDLPTTNLGLRIDNHERRSAPYSTRPELDTCGSLEPR